MNFKKLAIVTIFLGILVGSIWVYNAKTNTLPIVVSNASMIADFSETANLLKHSDIVVKGTIKETKGAYTTPEGLTFTEYSVSVDETIEGSLSESLIIVRQVGGEREETDKDGRKIKYIAMEENHPLFKTGETYILFLNKNPNENKYTVGTLGYGAYKVSNGMAKNGYPGLTRDEKAFINEIKKAAEN